MSYSKLIKFKTRSKFDAQVKNIPSASIVFIEDTGEIWTHGKFYAKTNGSDHNHDGSYVKYNDVVMNTNSFGGKKLYINSINNAMYAADKRFIIKATLYNLDGTGASDISSSVGNMFNGSYENGLSITANKKVVIEFDFNPKWSGYPYGTLYLSFYHSKIPLSVEGRVYNDYEPHGIGWHTLSFTKFNDAPTAMIYSSKQGKYGLCKLELTITAKSDTDCTLTQVDYNLDRPHTIDASIIGKFAPERLYYNLTNNESFIGKSFIKSGSDNTYILLGGGGQKAISDFSLSDHNHNSLYAPISHSNITSGNPHGVSYQNIGGTVPTWNQNTTGNAATADKLKSIVTTFDGKYPVTVNVNGTIYSHDGLQFEGKTGTLTATKFVGALEGNAATVTNGVYLTATQTLTNKTLTAPIIHTIVNQGYQHRLEIGRPGYDRFDFYEYGGIYNFYKCTDATGEVKTLLGKITTNGWEGNVKGNVTGNVSGSSGSCTGNAATVTNGVYTNTAQTISGKKTFSVQQAFTVAQGTAPFTVASNTVITNLNADLLDGLNSLDFAHTLGQRSFGSSNDVTTAEFVELLKTAGMFRSSYNVCRGSWHYAGQVKITDTGLGIIGTAGSIIEVVGSTSAYTIRITLPTTSSGGTTNQEYIYVNNGADYAPGWRRVWNNKNFNPDLKANLASPSFTGTPTAPTATPGTNTAQLATTAFVRKEVSDLVGGAPESLDTLKEIADYLTNGSVAGSIVDQLSKKVNKAGDTMTGDLSNSKSFITTGDNSGIYIGNNQNFGIVKKGGNRNVHFLNTSGDSFIFSKMTGQVIPSTIGNPWTDLVTINQNGLLNAIGGLQVNGQNVWHSGNLTGNQTGHVHDQYYDSNLNRTKNTILAAPNGSDGKATFRTLVAADLPSHNHDYLPALRMLNTSINSALEIGTIPFNVLALKTGYPLMTDPEFKNGMDGVGKYANSGGESLSLIREANIDGANNSGYCIKFVNTGNCSPGLGGFYNNVTARKNAIFVQIFRAKLPTGYRFDTASNSMGNSYTDNWITSNSGTGKWEWYGRVIYCGASGTFSSGSHIYVNGTAGVTWYMSYCNVYDVTKGNYDGLRTRFSDLSDASTKLNTARSINGTNFDGTADITTANWGTARNLTIGNTAKSVNGGGNVSWTLAEIGAAPAVTGGYLPLSGGTMTGPLKMGATSHNETNIATALSYGKLTGYGNLQLLANTDATSGDTEYVQIAAAVGNPTASTTTGFIVANTYAKANMRLDVTNGMNLTGCLNIQANSGSWTEGIRIKPNSGWSTIVLGGTDLTANTGTSANSWSLHANSGNFYLSRNGSNQANITKLACINNNWSANGHTIWHAGNFNINSKQDSIYAGWVNSPGYDANTIATQRVGFSYANNCPNAGPLLHFGPDNYSLQFSAGYGSGSSNIHYRTRNGDAGGAWSSWCKFWHSSNSGTTSYDWSAKSLTLAGGISGVTTISSTSQIELNTSNNINFVAGGKGIIFNTSSAFKPHDVNSNQLTLGTGSARWSTIYGTNLNLNGTITGATTIDATSIIKSTVSGKSIEMVGNASYGKIQVRGGVPLSLNPEGNNVAINTTAAAINLAIGDSDTGFKWNSDGNISGYANNVNVFSWTSGGVTFSKPITVGGLISGSTSLRLNTKNYHNVANRTTTTATETGIIKIKLPYKGTNSMNTYEIDIYQYNSRGHSKIYVSGYNHAGGWINTSATVLGTLANNKIRLANDGTNDCILIGETTTAWSYPQIYLSKVTQGFSNTADWSSGYEISIINDETGIAGIVTPTVNANMPFNNYVHPTFTARTAGGARHFITGFGSNTEGHVTSISTTAMTKADIEALLTGSITSHTHSYLPLSGGTLTGKIYIKSAGSDAYGGGIEVRERDNVTTTQSVWSYSPAISFHWGGRHVKRFGLRSDGKFAVDDIPLSLDNHTHSYLPLSGGTMTGAITGANGSSNGFKFGNARITSVSGNDIISLGTTEFRLSDSTTWDYNSWGGFKYESSSKIMYIGGPSGSKFSSNASPSNVTIDMTLATAGVEKVKASALEATSISSSGSITGNNVWSIRSKELSLLVTEAWMDTGIVMNAANFPDGDGTYVVELYSNAHSASALYSMRYSGIMPVYTGSSNSTTSDEIMLTSTGHADNGRALYLRLLKTATPGNVKIQIASSIDWTAAGAITFKYKRLM